MSRTALTGMAAAAGLMLIVSGAPVAAQSADTTSASDKTAQAVEKGTTRATDAALVSKVKTKLAAHSSLKSSDIDVAAADGVIVLSGTAASESARAKAIELARDTAGVMRVEDQLTIGPADSTRPSAKTSAKAAGADVKSGAKEVGHDTASAAKNVAGDTADLAKDVAHQTSKAAKKVAGATADAAKDVGSDSKAVATTGAQSTKEAGKAMASDAGAEGSDGWITGKVKASYVDVDALEGSTIHVDTTDHVVTLTGTVPTAQARTTAVSLAKQVKGVTRVVDNLTIAPKQ